MRAKCYFVAKCRFAPKCRYAAKSTEDTFTSCAGETCRQIGEMILSLRSCVWSRRDPSDRRGFHHLGESVFCRNVCAGGSKSLCFRHLLRVLRDLLRLCVRTQTRNLGSMVKSPLTRLSIGRIRAATPSSANREEAHPFIPACGARRRGNSLHADGRDGRKK